jgi:hypothetical protein
LPTRKSNRHGVAAGHCVLFDVVNRVADVGEVNAFVLH